MNDAGVQRTRNISTGALFVVLLGAMLLGCANTPGNDPGGDPSARSLWRSRGYGMVWLFNGGVFTEYQVTKKSRYVALRGTIERTGESRGTLRDDDGDFYFSFEETGGQLLGSMGDGTVIQFDPLPELDDVEYTKPTTDPVANFEVFWTLFDEQFALFPQLALDWQSVYDTYRPRVAADTTPEQLFSILGEMVALTRDGHTSLEAEELDLEAEGGSARPLPSDWLFDDENQALLKTAVAKYLDGGVLSSQPGEHIQSGTVAGRSIGYVAVHTMSDFTNAGSPPDDEQEFAQQFDSVLSGFKDKSALIIDLRLNDGGWDSVAMALASRLTSEVRPAYTKQARIGGYDVLAEPTAVSFGPAGEQFLGKPVIVLVSNISLSAAEVCLLALQHLPDVKFVGETSYGIFSNVLSIELPNGWEGGLSNEVYRSAEGMLYEHVGVPPHVAVTQDEDALADAKDNVLERALALLPKP